MRRRDVVTGAGLAVGATLAFPTPAITQGIRHLRMVTDYPDGPGMLAMVRHDLTRWLEDHEYESLRQAQGSMSLHRSPDPAAFERGNYMRVLQTWRPRA